MTAPEVGHIVRHAAGRDAGRVLTVSPGEVLVEWDFVRDGEARNEVVPYAPDLLLWDEGRQAWTAPRTGPEALEEQIMEALLDERSLLRKRRRPRAPDDGLRPIVRSSIPGAQWTTIETGQTSGGVPDLEFCFPGGTSGWVECKATRAWAIKFRPGQPGWIGRRARLGGLVWIAVRRHIPRSETDELWITHGSHVQEVALHGGLRAPVAWRMWRGGPGRWNWDEVAQVLAGRAWP